LVPATLHQHLNLIRLHRKNPPNTSRSAWPPRDDRNRLHAGGAARLGSKAASSWRGFYLADLVGDFLGDSDAADEVVERSRGDLDDCNFAVGGPQDLLASRPGAAALTGLLMAENARELDEMSKSGEIGREWRAQRSIVPVSEGLS
jgi:hypothetical protein